MSRLCYDLVRHIMFMYLWSRMINYSHIYQVWPSLVLCYGQVWPIMDQFGQLSPCVTNNGILWQV